MTNGRTMTHGRSAQALAALQGYDSSSPGTHPTSSPEVTGDRYAHSDESSPSDASGLGSGSEAGVASPPQSPSASASGSAQEAAGATKAGGFGVAYALQHFFPKAVSKSLFGSSTPEMGVPAPAEAADSLDEDADTGSPHWHTNPFGDNPPDEADGSMGEEQDQQQNPFSPFPADSLGSTSGFRHPHTGSGRLSHDGPQHDTQGHSHSQSATSHSHEQGLSQQSHAASGAGLHSAFPGYRSLAHGHSARAGMQSTQGGVQNAQAAQSQAFPGSGLRVTVPDFLPHKFRAGHTANLKNFEDVYKAAYTETYGPALEDHEKLQAELASLVQVRLSHRAYHRDHVRC